MLAMAWLVCALLGATVVGPPHPALGETVLESTVQMGAGRLDEDPVALLRPRLHYARGDADVALAVPLWVRLRDLPPRRATSQRLAFGSAWLANWRDPATYLGMLERVQIGSSSGSWRLAAGGQSDLRLGDGALVDGYTNTLDASLPVAGARLDLRLPATEVRLVAGSLWRSHLFAASVRSAPLVVAGLTEDARLTALAELAVDPAAPSFGGGHMAGGADLGLRYQLLRGETLGLAVFIDGVALLRTAFGAHAGVRLEMAPGKGEDDVGLAFEVQGVQAGSDYQPQYFGIAYEAERYGIRRRLPKREVLLAAGQWACARLDLHLGRGHGGFAVRSKLGEGGDARLYLGGESAYWRVEASLAQLHVERAQDVWRLRANTYFVLDGSVDLHAGWFAFARASQSWRILENAARPAKLWLLGFGWGARAAE